MKKFWLATTGLFFAINISAQIDTVQMQEVEISSQYNPMVYSGQARVVRVITATELQNLPVKSLQEVLTYSAGIDIRQRGVDGVQADISIRGGTFDQTLVLLNGVPMNDPQTGHHTLNLPVDPKYIERIEILEGAAARLYGINAYSGAVNIITKTGCEKNICILLSAAEYDTYKAGISVSCPIGKTTNFINIDKKNSGGYQHNTDYNQWNLYYRGGLKTTSGNLELQAGYINKAFGANSFYTPKYPDQFEQTRTLLTHLKWISAGRIRFTPEIYYRRNQDRFELFRNEAPEWYKNHNYHLTDVYGANISTGTWWVAGKTSVGAAYRSENLLSNVLGKTMNDTITAPGEKDGFFTKKDYRNNYILYVDHLFLWKKLTISAGTLANYNTSDCWRVFSGMDAAWAFTGKLQLFATFNQSFRLPTFTDLYYQGPTNTGNPNLRPETAENYEAGLRYSFSRITGNLAYFRRYSYHLIDWVRENNSDKWQSMNHGNIITDGIEFAATLKPFAKSEAAIRCNYLQINYAWLYQKKNKEELISYYVLDYLNHKTTLSVQLALFRHFIFNAGFSLRERNGTYTSYPDGIEKKYGIISQTDVRLAWQNSRVCVYADANNLFDEKYYDLGNIEMPGRWMSTGIQLNLFPHDKQ